MRLTDGALCPACEEGFLRPVQKGVEFKYKGEVTIVQTIAYECGECSEAFFDDKVERNLEKSLADIRRRVDGLLTSDEIRAIRAMFGMTQVDFARALRVGEKNFARYETGQSIQERTMDNLLRLLRENPKLMSIINKDWKGLDNKSNFVNMIIPCRKRKSRDKNKRKVSYQISGCSNDSEEVANACSF